MTPPPRRSWLWVRATIARRFRPLLALLLVVVLLGGFLTVAAYTDPPRETTTEPVSNWTATGTFAHQATVVNDSKAFPAGTTLDDRSVYFTSVSPTLEGAFTYSYTASDNGSVEADVSLAAIVRSVQNADEETPSVYWRYEEAIGRTSATLAPGETVRARFARNMSAVAADVRSLEHQLGGSPGTPEVLFVATVRVDGQRNGHLVDRVRTYRLPVTLESRVYRVEDPGPIADGDSRSVQRVTTVPAGPLWRFGGPVLVAIGLGGLGGLSIARHLGRFEVTATERDSLDYRRDRREFDEWITTARLPTDRLAGAGTTVEVTSLGGLVDLAIDTDRRVLESTTEDCYVVLAEDVIYSFEPPGSDGCPEAMVSTNAGVLEDGDTDQQVDEVVATEAPPSET